MMPEEEHRPLIAALAETVSGRIEAVYLAAERLDRLPENQERLAVLDHDSGKLAEEFLFRLLRVAIDATNFDALKVLVREDRLNMTELAQLAGLPTLAVAERVADMVQVGLVDRALVGNEVRARPSAVALVEFFTKVTSAVEGHLQRISERQGG
jgi:hypothetical protein